MNSCRELPRVLVVDDERVVADSLAAILRSQGYRAWPVYSAIGAMNAARDIAPHAVISDVLMPGMNGMELAAYLAEHHPDCQVVLMSGDSSATNLLNTALRQAYPHSTHNKTVGPTQFLETIAALVPVA